MKTDCLYHPIILPGVTIPGNLFLAPLAGITDRGFRRICIEHGAPFTYTEMVSGEALARRNLKTIALLRRAKGEKLLGVQIFLSNPEQAERALPVIEKADPTLIDLNCGCPVPKVVKTGAGAALMRSPETIYRIVSLLARSSFRPITVKLRTGWDSNTLNYLEAAQAAESAGAAMITLHGRTRSQGYSGSADWSAIAKLVQTVRVPVIGNGDAFSPEAAKRLLMETGCSGVMFARGAMGNPFIFEQTRRVLEHDPTGGSPSVEEIMKAALIQLHYTIEDKGERVACREMRKQMAGYTKGLDGSAALRQSIVTCETEEDYRRTVEDYLSRRG
ncbi:tRNA dihydrouridine synthase DusB [Sediminispirochaeta bajacaliforniensis]|uniref:tRNA dihydrouridine synthase DusB n=1 Tax=Sediminispirochaeta bajacaliforniensis TaxID=148 RepID=UPI000362DD9B|nr:tRNA dihydrouridine synthase DusB [Sediminispirochaeta bajacaliforniensis]